jgi:hypothetical protein
MDRCLGEQVSWLKDFQLVLGSTQDIAAAIERMETVHKRHETLTQLHEIVG